MLSAPWWTAKGACELVSRFSRKVRRPIEMKQNLSAVIHRRRRFWQSSPFTTRNDDLEPGRRSFDFRHFAPLCDAITPGSGQVQQFRGCRQEDRVSGYDLSSWNMRRPRPEPGG